MIAAAFSSSGIGFGASSAIDAGSPAARIAASRDRSRHSAPPCHDSRSQSARVATRIKSPIPIASTIVLSAKFASIYPLFPSVLRDRRPSHRRINRRRLVIRQLPARHRRHLPCESPRRRRIRRLGHHNRGIHQRRPRLHSLTPLRHTVSDFVRQQSKSPHSFRHPPQATPPPPAPTADPTATPATRAARLRHRTFHRRTNRSASRQSAAQPVPMIHHS